MAIYATNNFDADTVGSLAPGWTVKSGTWVVGTDRPVSGARSFGTTTGADGDVAIYTGAAASADMGIQYDFIIDTLGRGFGAGVRFDSAYSNGYLFLVYGVTGSLWYYKFKKVANAFSAIGAAVDTGIAVPNGTVVHVRTTAIGSNISLFLSVGANALPTTPTATFTDSSVTAAGYPLLYRANNGYASSAGTIDNFQYDDAAVPVNSLVSGTANVLFSPYNWNVTTSAATTINPGAYFKTIFAGTACALQFDMTGILTPLPQIAYRIDGTGAWITAPLAASIALTLPSGTADYATKGGHLLEVVVKSMTETQARWSTQATAVSLTGIVLDAGATLTKPPALPLNAIFYGDSITEGVRTLNGTASADTDRNDAAQGWAYRAAQILGAEAGIIGFGGSGFTVTGSGGVPVLSTSYNLIYSGVSRSFAVAPDFIVLMEGTNDGGDVTTAATTALNGLIAATTATTKIIVLRPFNGTAHASQLQAAIAACTTPARCAYIDTAGWFTTANSYDTLHPYGNENLIRIAPLAADAIRPYVQPLKGVRTARTVTLTLNDRLGSPRANLSSLKWAFFDQATAGALGVAVDGGTSAATNASGVLTLTVYTTLASGATGWLVLSDSAGNAAVASNAFSGPVQVA
jgi:lysophospholipase L1-like esterase